MYRHLLYIAIAAALLVSTRKGALATKSLKRSRRYKILGTSVSSDSGKEDGFEQSPLANESFAELEDTVDDEGEYIKAVKALAAMGLGPNQPVPDWNSNDMEYPIVLAVKYKDHDLLRYLLNQKVDLNVGVQTSPLMLAIQSNDEAAAHILIENGADPHFILRGGLYADPFIAAIHYGNHGIIEHMMHSVKDYNYESFGQSPLLTAIMHGRSEVVEKLIEGGADPNMKLDHGKSALFTLLHFDDETHNEIFRYLLNHKANPLQEDDRGWTVAQLAKLQDHTGILSILDDFDTTKFKRVSKPDIPTRNRRFTRLHAIRKSISLRSADVASCLDSRSCNSARGQSPWKRAEILRKSQGEGNE